MVAACMVFYIVTALLKLVITLAGRNYRPPRWQRVWPEDPTLPAYAVLLPVHKEANMLRHLVSRVDKLVYPRRKLLALLLIEHDDLETLEAARKLRIPLLTGRTTWRPRISANRGDPAERPEDQAERDERGNEHRGQRGLRICHRL